jgi:hypothetical protein
MGCIGAQTAPGINAELSMRTPRLVQAGQSWLV